MVIQFYTGTSQILSDVLRHISGAPFRINDWLECSEAKGFCIGWPSIELSTVVEHLLEPTGDVIAHSKKLQMMKRQTGKQSVKMPCTVLMRLRDKKLLHICIRAGIVVIYELCYPLIGVGQIMPITVGFIQCECHKEIPRIAESTFPHCRA